MSALVADDWSCIFPGDSGSEENCTLLSIVVSHTCNPCIMLPYPIPFTGRPIDRPGDRDVICGIVRPLCHIFQPLLRTRVLLFSQ